MGSGVAHQFDAVLAQLPMRIYHTLQPTLMFSRGQQCICWLVLLSDPPDLAEGNYALVSRCGAWLDNVEAAQMMNKPVDEMSTAAETGSVCPA